MKRITFRRLSTRSLHEIQTTLVCDGTYRYNVHNLYQTTECQRRNYQRSWMWIISWRLLETYAALICSIPSFSPKTHGCHSGEPYCIVPRMILETLSPELPSRTNPRLLAFKQGREVDWSSSVLTIRHTSLPCGHGYYAVKPTECLGCDEKPGG